MTIVSFRNAPRTVALAATFMGTLALAGVADAKLARQGDAAVAFNATGPAGMKITGTTNELTVGDDGSAVTVVVPLANLKTGISLRDDHMRNKYLQVQQYPTAELQVPRSALKFPAAGGDATGDAQGTMKLHGKTKNVTFHYAAKRDGNKYKVSGSVHILMTDYGIELPSYFGVTVKPDVNVNVSFEAAE